MLLRHENESVKSFLKALLDPKAHLDASLDAPMLAKVRNTKALYSCLLDLFMLHLGQL